MASPWVRALAIPQLPLSATVRTVQLASSAADRPGAARRAAKHAIRRRGLAARPTTLRRNQDRLSMLRTAVYCEPDARLRGRELKLWNECPHGIEHAPPTAFAKRRQPVAVSQNLHFQNLLEPRGQLV